MDHPLISDAQSELRRRVVQQLSAGYNIARFSHIVFVCGGNDPSHMRQKFKNYCDRKKPRFEIFFPEFAMNDYFSGPVTEQFDIADFENLVGRLSHAIVIFPEAPGSYAETGYFCLVDELSRKTVLVLDTAYQNRDSFISMGPARKIGRASVFEPNISMNFKKPKFQDIIDRLGRINPARSKRRMITDHRVNENEYDIFCLVFKLVDLLQIATFQDILYILRAMTKSQISSSLVRKISSIMVGANYLVQVGDYGHYRVNSMKRGLTSVRDGFASAETQLRLALATLIQSGDHEFRVIVETPINAD